MLTRMRIRNLKSWPDTGDIALKPITGFFGANSSGKTSLLQALLLLKQTSDSSDRALTLHFGDKTSLVSLGDFQSAIYGHELSNELVFELDWLQPKSFVVTDPREPANEIVRDERLGFSTRICAENGRSGKVARLVVPELAYRVGNATFGMRQKSEGQSEYSLFAEGTHFQFLRRAEGRKWPVPAPAKCYGFPDQVRAYHQNAEFLSDLELALESQLRRIHYLGPLRAYPGRTYTWAGAQPTDMGQAGDKAVDALLSSRDRREKISRGKGRRRVTLEQYVAEWLERLGLIAEFRVESVAEGSQIFQVKVRKLAGGPESLITDVGFGVSQVLPVVVLCFYVPEGSTVILEQPEIHLHPAVQAGLADVLLDAYRHRQVQILLESHSEHLLRRLQRRVAEETASPADLGLYFCEMGPKGSTLTNLQLDMFGRITNWPKDFFGDEFGELAATQQAAISRRRRG